jgi:hypothetical protein
MFLEILPSCTQLWTILLSLQAKPRRFIWLLFSAQFWALWNIRNKFTIEAVFLKQPAEFIFKTAIYLQHWHLLQGIVRLPPSTSCWRSFDNPTENHIRHQQLIANPRTS